MEPMMTSEEVAKILRLDKRTVQYHAKQGNIPGAVKIGKMWRFNPEKLREWLEAGQPMPPRKTPQPARPTLPAYPPSHPAFPRKRPRWLKDDV